MVVLILAFFNVIWSWIAIGLLSVLLSFITIVFKRRRWKDIPELSPLANSMMQRYGHFYTLPVTCRNYSGLASALMLATVVVAIVGALDQFWWGFGLLIVSWVLLYPISKALNPGSFIRGTADEAAHQEVVGYLLEKAQAGMMVESA